MSARTARHRTRGCKNVAVERYYSERETVFLRYGLCIVQLVDYKRVAEQKAYDFIVIRVETYQIAGKSQRTAVV